MSTSRQVTHLPVPLQILKKAIIPLTRAHFSLGRLMEMVAGIDATTRMTGSQADGKCPAQAQGVGQS